MPLIPMDGVKGAQFLAIGHGSQDRLGELCRMVQGCRACPRMEGRRRVLSGANGRVGAKVLFIAEAPGRNGADRTGVPLHGDPSGNQFERLLRHVGWRRGDVFVTNCVLCNPRTEAGLNDTPTFEELSACSFHLEHQIDLVDPLVVATLGAKALQALNLIEAHDFTLSRCAATPLTWYNRALIPLYHPSPRALTHRSLDRQREDFMVVRKLVDHLEDGIGRTS